MLLTLTTSKVDRALSDSNLLSKLSNRVTNDVLQLDFRIPKALSLYRDRSNCNPCVCVCVILCLLCFYACM